MEAIATRNGVVSHVNNALDTMMQEPVQEPVHQEAFVARGVNG
jgi:hypothetical protein